MEKSKKLNWSIMGLYMTVLLFSAYIVVMYFIIGTEGAQIMKGKMEDENFNLAIWKALFYPHIILGAIALAVGPFQLTKTSRQNPNLHRNLGKIYGFTIFINVLLVPYISLFSTGGRSSMIAFLVLNAFWLGTTAMGVLRGFQKRISSHKTWILRSYAITWVFVSFRIVVIPFSAFLDLAISFPIAVYLSIALNLLFVEWKRKKEKTQSLSHHSMVQ
ncbi:hypothetical protein AC623_10920 [Bacillus sp. FJAT-27231]|uniref:DUF2306 domain-containing protein n=1 Tax=Bacillus sp. FJAT-27231 TaxID=1679168 RepID=UPI000670DE55|nr:DUF2306 domain-containing protein [Bacillus sp. FJAT-27231]KMY54377.1 hypothetical protein AC623_10920 [Bacillus sp. FJAT-27231]